MRPTRYQLRYHRLEVGHLSWHRGLAARGQSTTAEMGRGELQPRLGEAHRSNTMRFIEQKANTRRRARVASTEGFSDAGTLHTSLCVWPVLRATSQNHITR